MRRPFVLTILVVCAATAGCGAAADEPDRREGRRGAAAPALWTYTDADFGWSIEYPAPWYLDTSQQCLRICEWYTTIASFDAAHGPMQYFEQKDAAGGLLMGLEGPDKLRDAPPTGVALRIHHFEGGPYVGPCDAAETRLPLSLDDFGEPEGSPWGPGRSRMLNFFVNGNGWSAGIWIGGAATPDDVAALRATVGSLRFPDAKPSCGSGRSTERDRNLVP